MIKQNDSANFPLHFVLEDGRIAGQFYNSKDKQYHLSFYVPYEVMPSVYLCGRQYGNFSQSRAEGEQRGGKCCPGCVAKLKELSGLSEEEFRRFGYF